VAWDAEISLKTALEGELRSFGDGRRAKSEAAAQKARMGTAPVPIGGYIGLFLALLGEILAHFCKNDLFFHRSVQLF